MDAAIDLGGYWDRYAGGVAEETPREALKYAFGWCQYPGHGPGDGLLGEPLTALELGFGRGSAVAALASKSVEATGVDVSPVQWTRARERWAHLAEAHRGGPTVLKGFGASSVGGVETAAVLRRSAEMGKGRFPRMGTGLFVLRWS
jgi:hypothetical protein